MPRVPIIPLISRVKLTGYQPLFNRTIEFEVSSGRFLILGGNGLGKTTILQSIVYCIAGEADVAIEQEKGHRWTRKYFRGRLRNPDNASIEVEIQLGPHKVTLGRGFRTKQLLYCNIDDVVFENPREAEQQFEQFLREMGGYPNLDDFRYMVHKLCYLPENRANLVWNSEDQIRLIMLMFGDIIDEEEFRKQRRIMKEYDSKRRHINVHLNSARRELSSQNSDSSEVTAVKVSTVIESITLTPQLPVRDYNLIAGRLNVLARERVEKQKDLRLIRRDLSTLTVDIEAIQDQLVREEEAFILNELNKIESEEARLAIHKLLHRKQCPACSTESRELSEKAQQYIKEGRCPLCGTDQKIGDPQQLPLLDAELSEKLRSRINIEEQLLQLEQKLEQLQDEEEILQLQYDEYRITTLDTQGVIIEDAQEAEEKVLFELPIENESIEDRVNRLQQEYNEAEMRFNQIQHELDRKYASFNRSSRDRIDMLAQLYQEYATAFLGIPCELETHRANIQFLDINLYVPKFDEQIRPNPESCSEAQRFFLDIAFRMAMIDLCYKLGESHGSFICETPENALDITYVDNVAEMFKSFSRRGHVFIATSNLQPGALARPMLSDYSLDEKQESILNLLEYGSLSKVQRDHLPVLEQQLEYILQGQAQ